MGGGGFLDIPRSLVWRSFPIPTISIYVYIHVYLHVHVYGLLPRVSSFGGRYLLGGSSSDPAHSNHWTPAHSNHWADIFHKKLTSSE